jgi:hypothetical protein
MGNTLWHIFGPFVLGALGWFAVNFFGKPLLDFLTLRKEIQEELTFLANVGPPENSTLYERGDEAYAEEVKAFRDFHRSIRRLAAKMSAMGVSLEIPLYKLASRALDTMGFRVHDATKQLLSLSTWHYEDDDRILARYRVEVALRLPHAEERLVESIIEYRSQETRHEDAELTPISPHEIRPGPADDTRECHRGPGPADCVMQGLRSSGRAPDPAEMAARCGAETPVLDWREKLVCSKCGGRHVDMVVTGTKR